MIVNKQLLNEWRQFKNDSCDGYLSRKQWTSDLAEHTRNHFPGKTICYKKKDVGRFSPIFTSGGQLRTHFGEMGEIVWPVESFLYFINFLLVFWLTPYIFLVILAFDLRAF